MHRYGIGNWGGSRSRHVLPYHGTIQFAKPVPYLASDARAHNVADGLPFCCPHVPIGAFSYEGAVAISNEPAYSGGHFCESLRSLPSD